MKPISMHSRGAGVEDVQRRLAMLGYQLGIRGIDGVYLDETAAAVRAFRKDEGLPEADYVDDACWSALVDATFPLGDRTLYLRTPYFHGNDVRQLQLALSALGFACGSVDGIFGANTERAVREFQGNVGIEPDGIAGSWTFEAVKRLHHVWEGKDLVPDAEERAGFSRAASVLERIEACFFGTDAMGKQISERIANLASATTPDSRVVSASSLEAAPPATMILIQISCTSAMKSVGIPFIVFSDENTLPARIKTAATSAASRPPRISVGVPASYFVDCNAPTVREQQHVAVALLDAFCEAFS